MLQQTAPPVPLPENEEERLIALKSYNILDTAEDEDFDELTVLASAICQTPIALITLIDDKRQWFKSHPGIPQTETPKEIAFCTHTIVQTNDIMVVNDARRDERFANNPLVTGDTRVIFYAGVPLVNEDGFALGSLCVIDHQHKELTDVQTNALKIIAKQVINKLELRRKAIVLEKINQDLRDANIFIQKFASMAAHDIKNPLSSISLTSQALKLRMQKIQDEGCERLIDLNITSTKRLMVLIDEMLAYSKSPSLLLVKKQRIYLKHTLKQVIDMITIPDDFEINLPEDDALLNLSVVAFEQIFGNLINNAIRYNNKDRGIINISYTHDDDYYRFEVADNGMGIAPQYHEKIFGNNFTLKITDRYNNKGSGIGLSTVKDLVKAMNGSIHVKSTVGEGATFYIAIKK
jgi:signal transduction histidine kinase